MLLEYSALLSNGISSSCGQLSPLRFLEAGGLTELLGSQLSGPGLPTVVPEMLSAVAAEFSAVKASSQRAGRKYPAVATGAKLLSVHTLPAMASVWLTGLGSGSQLAAEELSAVGAEIFLMEKYLFFFEFGRLVLQH